MIPWNSVCVSTLGVLFFRLRVYVFSVIYPSPLSSCPCVSTVRGDKLIFFFIIHVILEVISMLNSRFSQHGVVVTAVKVSSKGAISASYTQLNTVFIQ